MAGNIPCWIKLNGVSSRTFGIISEKIPDYALPERQGDVTIIPGSNQPVFIDGGGYKPVDRTYNLAIVFDSYITEEVLTMPTPFEYLSGKKIHYMGETTSSYTHDTYYQCVYMAGVGYRWSSYTPTNTLADAARKFSKWLYRSDGFVTLEDEYDAGLVVSARIKTPGSVSLINDQAATLQVTFECSAERILNDSSRIVYATWIDRSTDPPIHARHETHTIPPSPLFSVGDNGFIAKPSIIIEIGRVLAATNGRIYICDSGGHYDACYAIIDFTDFTPSQGTYEKIELDCKRHILLNSRGENISSRITLGSLGWPSLVPGNTNTIVIRKAGTVSPSNVPIYRTGVNPRWWTI